MKYRPEIDGLRALAVVPVILFHAGFELFSGGFVGVDVFFVISGYLITTILIEDIENNRFNILNFYERRARRILPALFFVMLVCIPFAWIWILFPSQMKDFSQSLVAVSLFASNILFWRESGYFEAAAEEKPLLHTWSLAVEEQFYLLFPIFLFLVWRFGKNRVFWMIVIIAAISLALSEWGWRNMATANFYLAPTRAWELFAGSIVAFTVQKHGVRANNALSLLGLAIIVFAIFIYDESTPFPSVYSLAPVVGVALLILFASKDTLIAKLLSTKAFVGIGLISYSAYLWHQPLFAFARIKIIGQPSLMLMGSLSLLSMLLAILSWKFIEQPFRKTSDNDLSRNTIFIISMTGILIMSSFGYVGHKQGGFRDRLEKILQGDVNHLEFHRYVDERYVDCEPESIAKKALIWESFIRCKQTKPGDSDWILLGDSHAEHLFLGMAESNLNKNLVFYIFGGKPYIDNPKFAEIFSEIKSSVRPKTIFLTMHFKSHVKESEELYAGFTATVKFLKQYGHKVILLGDIPQYDVHPEDCLYAATIELSISYCSMSKDDFFEQKNIFEPALKKIAEENHIRYVPMESPLCNNATCSMISGDTILYRDTNHLNIPGSRLVGNYLNQKLHD